VHVSILTTKQPAGLDMCLVCCAASDFMHADDIYMHIWENSCKLLDLSTCAPGVHRRDGACSQGK
jgi:hypothetical protein